MLTKSRRDPRKKLGCEPEADERSLSSQSLARTSLAGDACYAGALGLLLGWAVIAEQ